MPEPDGTPAAAFGGQYASYALRQHLAVSHHLPAGLSYLLTREDLPAFHATAHARPGRIRGWLRVRCLRRDRHAIH